VLDLGAGRCWTTKELVKRGAVCTAVDIVKDYGVGLDTAKVYWEQGFKFDTVQAGMNNLPFSDASLEVVNIYASLHHSENIPKSLDEAKRVLKKGGMLVLSGEPAGRIYYPLLYLLPNKFRQKYGLNEQTPHILEWKRWIKSRFDCKIKVSLSDLVWGRNLFIKGVKK
jgi:ubiquinone/menaquinone biosynthesis C-methylase UbiE